MEKVLNIEKYDEWLEKHFEELITKYSHKAIAVVGDEIVAIGESEKEVDRKAREIFPGEIPFVMTVPSEEDLVCLLFIGNISNTNS
jgi:hypothetical protein